MCTFRVTGDQPSWFHWVRPRGWGWDFKFWRRVKVEVQLESSWEAETKRLTKS